MDNWLVIHFYDILKVIMVIAVVLVTTICFIHMNNKFKDKEKLSMLKMEGRENEFQSCVDEKSKLYATIALSVGLILITFCMTILELHY